MSLNPDNPRSSLGDLTDLAGSLRTHGRKQAIMVMNRDAYLLAEWGIEEVSPGFNAVDERSISDYTRRNFGS
ncbi:hypothetical protein ACWD7F_39730, partial [Streptomyces sp. NPDC005122]